MQERLETLHWCPEGTVADDGKRSEAEWTLFVDGIEERVPGGEGKPARPDGSGTCVCFMLLESCIFVFGSSAIAFVSIALV